MSACNLHYTLISNFNNDFESIFEDIEKGPIVVVEVVYEVECVEDEGCVEDVSCAWGPYTKTLLLDVPLREIFIDSDTKNGKNCLSCIDKCHDAFWSKGLCMKGCYEDECEPYIDDNGGEGANVVDNAAFDVLFQEAAAANTLSVCGCGKPAPDEVVFFQLGKSIKAYFDELCKREIA